MLGWEEIFGLGFVDSVVVFSLVLVGFLAVWFLLFFVRSLLVDEDDD